MNDESPSKRKPWNKFAFERVESDVSPAVIWNLSGLFSDCRTSYGFLDAFREEVRDGDRPIVIDLSQVNHVTSCGAGILGACYCSATNAERKMCLAGAPERALMVLQIIGLAKVIDMYETREAALHEITT